MFLIGSTKGTAKIDSNQNCNSYLKRFTIDLKRTKICSSPHLKKLQNRANPTALNVHFVTTGDALTSLCNRFWIVCRQHQRGNYKNGGKRDSQWSTFRTQQMCRLRLSVLKEKSILDWIMAPKLWIELNRKIVKDFAISPLEWLKYCDSDDSPLLCSTVRGTYLPIQTRRMHSIWLTVQFVQQNMQLLRIQVYFLQLLILYSVWISFFFTA